MSTPAVLYRAAPNTDCRPMGPPRFKFPLPQNSPVQFAAYQFDQDFEMRMAASTFPPAQKNVPASFKVGAVYTFGGIGDDNALLTALSAPTPTGAGMARFTATFVRIPAEWDDYKTTAFNYPGWLGIISSSTARDPLTEKVQMRLHYKYYLVDPTGIIAGLAIAPKDSAGAAINVVASMGLIPGTYKTYFYTTKIVGGVPTPIFTAKTNSLVIAGGQSPFAESFPTTQTYQAWLANATAAAPTGGWATLVWNGLNLTQANVGQLQADDSYLEVYAGNIVACVTPYVLVK